MMEKMIFGRFIPGDSFVHQIGSTFQIDIYFYFYYYCVFGKQYDNICIVIAIYIFSHFDFSRIRLYFLINGLKPVIILIIFTFLIAYFFTREGDVLFDWDFKDI